MHLPIVVVTHGKASIEILNTAYMLIGEQEHIKAVDFLPGENVESLKIKLTNVATEMINAIPGADKSTQPVLFVVDVISGSPWNASALLMRENPNFHLISGVNIPLVLSLMMERDDNDDLAELINNCIEQASYSIKYFNAEVICQN